jgi:hypothetical protein
MRRFVTSLIAAAIGAACLIPATQARAGWWDMYRDRVAINRGYNNIARDRRELRWDVNHGRYGEAAEEQREIMGRYGNIARNQADLNGDVARWNWNRNYAPQYTPQYYGYGNYPTYPYGSNSLYANNPYYGSLPPYYGQNGYNPWLNPYYRHRVWCRNHPWRCYRPWQDREHEHEDEDD